jgi:hypothetical protein
MPYHRHTVKGSFNEDEARRDLARIATEDLHQMVETNLRHIILAWEGNVPERVTRNRAQWALAASREIRSRGIQLRLEL